MVINDRGELRLSFQPAHSQIPPIHDTMVRHQTLGFNAQMKPARTADAASRNQSRITPRFVPTLSPLPSHAGCHDGERLGIQPNGSQANREVLVRMALVINGRHRGRTQDGGHRDYFWPPPSTVPASLAGQGSGQIHSSPQSYLSDRRTTCPEVCT